jgi:hypothetical protein
MKFTGAFKVPARREVFFEMGGGEPQTREQAGKRRSGLRLSLSGSPEDASEDFKQDPDQIGWEPEAAHGFALESFKAESGH